jgi:hypothetical protein
MDVNAFDEVGMQKIFLQKYTHIFALSNFIYAYAVLESRQCSLRDRSKWLFHESFGRRAIAVFACW